MSDLEKLVDWILHEQSYTPAELEDKIKVHVKEVANKVIGEDNEHYKDMPVPDPSALPNDHQNQLRQYQRKKLKNLLGDES